MTIHETILYGEEILRQNRVDQPRWNSERVLMLALQQSRGRIYMDLNRELTPEENSRFHALLQKRSAHVPLAYLEGTQEFYGRDFFVNEAVLIPRPETEEIVRVALTLTIAGRPRILDLGSGSGNIAVTLALEIPGSFVVALEISPEAVLVMRKNLRGNVHAIRANFLALPFQTATFDAITANLPYVEKEEFDVLPAETSWEPRHALLVDSLEESYATVMTQASRLLKPDGILVMEFGAGQSRRLVKVSQSISGLQFVEIRNDYRGIPRVLVIRKY